MTARHVNVAIIGAGTAGMGAARAAALHDVSIALIEGDRYGTTCARVGCMPSKLLIAAAEAHHGIAKAAAFGIETAPARVNGRAVMARVRAERDRFVGFVIDSIETDFPKVEKIRATVRFSGPNRLALSDGSELTADRIVITTGSRPAYPEAWARDLSDRLITNDDVFYWDDLPESVAVFGGGVVGLELAQALSRLGVRVRLFGRDHGVGPLTDGAVRAAASAAFQDDFPFLPDAKVTEVRRDGNAVAVRFTDETRQPTEERFRYLLAATGRRPNVDKLGLETTGLPLDPRGIPLFDPTTMQWADSHIFIAGDADNAVPLLHEAADEGRIAGDNAARFPDVRARPRRAGLSVVFSDPQLAIAGLSAREIEAQGITHAVGEVSFEEQGRARVMLKNKGLLRVYGECGTGRFLGAEMAGPAAEHIAHLLAWAVQSNRTVQEMLDSPFYHPVIEEGLRTALRNLRHNLRMGPPPVERCIDCGPGG